MTQSLTAKNKKVLLVEDHPVFRAMLAQLIESERGLTVCGQADNCADAMMLIEETQPDAAIVDLTLNGPSGFELIQELQARHNPLPVLVLSMHVEKLYAERVRRAGAKGYLAKEESPAEVVKAIREVIAGRTYWSEAVRQQRRDSGV